MEGAKWLWEEFVKPRTQQLVELFSNFVRRDAASFRVTSEREDFGPKAGLCTALILVFIAAEIGLFVLLSIEFPGAKRFAGFETAWKWGLFVATLSSLLPLPLYIMLRRWTGRIPFTFVNLGMVLSTLASVSTGLCLLFGGLASPYFNEDITRFELGKGENSGVHSFVCGTLEDRAYQWRKVEDVQALNQIMETEVMKAVALGPKLIDAQTRYFSFRNRIVLQGSPSEADMQQMASFQEEGVRLKEKTLQIKENLLNLRSKQLDLMQQGVDAQNRINIASFRLAAYYPFFSAFIVVGILTGLYMWLCAAVITWKLTVQPQKSKRQRRVAGAMALASMILLFAAMVLARSGILEALSTPNPSQASVIASLKYEFSEAGKYCGTMNNYHAW